MRVACTRSVQDQIPRVDDLYRLPRIVSVLHVTRLPTLISPLSPWPSLPATHRMRLPFSRRRAAADALGGYNFNNSVLKA